jgi:DNA mismatch endonuclease, patch repair protein
MVDVHDRETRSRNMRAIRARHTKPERLVRSYLHRAGLRFRLHRRELPGQPDIVLPKYSAVVLVHGCYWHRHANCKYAVLPSSNTDFWLKKLEMNRQRDEKNKDRLRQQGWRVFVVWECEIPGGVALRKLVRSLKVPAECPKN